MSVLVVLVSLGGAGQSAAVTTETWRVSGRDAFLATALESLAVSSEGVVSLAPALAAVEGLEESFVWCLVPASDGVRAGTGQSGTVYRATPTRARRLSDTVSLDVESLVQGPGGILYAGTGPDGTIFKIGSDSTAATLADLPVRHVWGLALLPGGDVVAATGDPAALYRVTSGGTVSRIYEGPAGHFTTLALQGENILVGTDSGGLIYAVSPDGRGRVLLDADEEEVRGLLVADDGTVYAALNPAGAGTPPSPAAEGRAQTPRPVIYRIQPDGVVEPVWSSPDPVIYSLAFAEGGALLAGTGGGRAGGYFRIEPDRDRFALLGRPGPGQILSLLDSGGSIWVATGAPGKLYVGRSGGSPEGRMTSEVHDAGQVAHWGVLRWDRLEADPGSITFRTRSGNTARPDETWSEWSGPLSDGSGSQIGSPPGRYLQWEARFEGGGGGSPRLREVTAAYLEVNRAPQIRVLEVAPPGGSLARGGEDGAPQPVIQTLPGNVRVEYSIASNANRGPAPDEEAAWARRYRVIRWEASDPNGDQLLYTLQFRGRDEETWRTIEEEHRETVYTWDTAVVPDGRYQVKLSASDEPRNPPGEARRASRETDFITVDNTPPAAEQLTARFDGARVHVTARLTDTLGPLRGADLTLDGETWRPLHPVDRVFDETVEEIDVSVEVPEPAAAEYVIQIRPVDAAGNTAVARTTVRR